MELTIEFRLDREIAFSLVCLSTSLFVTNESLVYLRTGANYIVSSNIFEQLTNQVEFVDKFVKCEIK